MKYWNLDSLWINYSKSLHKLTKYSSNSGNQANSEKAAAPYTVITALNMKKARFTYRSDVYPCCWI
jgi:hypothetical protein